MRYIKISFGVFIILAITRFIPHPPNFTSLLALSFYVPALLGVRYLPVVVISFMLTDLILGFHSLTLFTWGSVIVIGFFSKFFKETMITRIFGSILGACLFFIISNFGVWMLGAYEHNLNGIILCYTLALPFFAYSLISTFIFSSIIESLYKLYFLKIKNLIRNN